MIPEELSSVISGKLTLLLLLLGFQRVQLSLLPIDLSLLRLNLLLHSRILVLALLHLISDQRAANKAYRSTDACAGARIARRTTDNRSQARSPERADRSAFLSCGQRFGTADKRQNKQQRR